MALLEIIKWMASEYIITKMEIFSKVNGKMVQSARVCSNLYLKFYLNLILLST
jgi:hypothetical protein